MLAELQQQAASCTKCKISACRIKSVWSEGNPDADYFFLGEAPGYWENKHGVPFYPGAAGGKKLTQVIKDLGLTRTEVYIANILKCRPPGNRDPLDYEVENCLPFLEAQIKAVAPKIIFVMGKVAAVALNLQRSNESLQRGWHDNEHYVVYHPAYIARLPDQYESWLEDLKDAISSSM